MVERKTMKQLLAEGHLEEYGLTLENGVEVEGYLIQERVNKTKDTEGYYIYDIRSGERKYKGNPVEVYYNTLEPNVCVDWADSIATKTPVDFGEAGYLNVSYDESDLAFMYQSDHEGDEDEE